MSEFIQGNPPYYDNYDPAKGYSAVLYRPGIVVQTQELNEMQSILKQNIRNIGGALLTDGDIIEGCQCIISDASEGSVAKKVKVTAGRIYFSGDIYDTADTELLINGVGTEIIGVKLIEEVITESEDPSLLDNAEGFANFQMSGAHRRKSYLSIVANDDTASTLFTISEGNIINIDSGDSDSVVIDRINTTLARRTYDESGNYIVDGLELSPKGESDSNNIMLNVSAGKAYIKGNELVRIASTTVPLERATELRSVELETQRYSQDNNMYPLNNSPVISEGLEVKAYIRATTTMTKGVSGGSDPFPHQYTANSIAEIFRVWDSSKNYELGRNNSCYKNGNSVKWNDSAQQPSSGSSYSVEFSYIKTLVFGTDYDLVVDANGNYCIKILKTSGADAPIDDTDLLIEYDFILYRRDLIVMDYLGNIKVIKGQSDSIMNVASPTIDTDDYMVLGSVLLTPLSDELAVVNNANKRLSMNEIQRLAERLSNVEVSVAMTNLDKEAMAGEDATNLVGIYTDGFIGMTKCDVSHTLFNCAFDLDNQEVTLSSEETLHGLSAIMRTDVSPISSFSEYASLITAPATETKVLELTDATGVQVINQYAVFSGNPVMDISPRQNNWIDNKTITVQGATVTRTATLRRWWYHGNASWAETEKAQFIALGFKDGGKSLGRNNGTVTQTHSAVASVLESAIKYMQQITITVVGQMFNAYKNNIIVTFDGNKVNMTPQSAAYKGDKTGTLKADVNGFTKGTFVIPANTLCGTVEVQMYPESEPNKLAVATFTSEGTLRETKQVVWKEITKVKTVDPVAQTFQFDTDQFITSVGIYFCATDGINDVSVQIRGTTNGYPNQTCYAEKILKGGTIRKSNDGTVETKVTFDDPVYCKKDTQYAICILTESNTNSLFYSELGQRDIRTNARLIKNPYSAGMMFSSSNAIAWTAHQGSNLKFSIYGNVYNAPGYVYFNTLSRISYDRIMIMADVSCPGGTSIVWEYTNDGGMNWMPIVLFNDMELSSILDNALVRARLEPNGTVSPVILADSCYLIGFSNNTESNYVSRNIVLDSKFNNVKQILSIYDPENSHTNVALYYAVDVDGREWKSGNQKLEETKDLGNGWKKFVFEDTVSGGASNFRARIYLTTNDPTHRPRVKNLMNILT